VDRNRLRNGRQNPGPGRRRLSVDFHSEAIRATSEFCPWTRAFNAVACAIKTCVRDKRSPMLSNMRVPSPWTRLEERYSGFVSMSERSAEAALMMDDVALPRSFWRRRGPLALVANACALPFDGGGHPGGPGQRVDAGRGVGQDGVVPVQRPERLRSSPKTLSSAVRVLRQRRGVAWHGHFSASLFKNKNRKHPPGPRTRPNPRGPWRGRRRGGSVVFNDCRSGRGQPKYLDLSLATSLFAAF